MRRCLLNHRFLSLLAVLAGLALACARRDPAAASQTAGCADAPVVKSTQGKVCAFPDASGAVPSKIGLDALCGCTSVEGDVSIDASAIRDIGCLNRLRAVHGKLEISARARSSVLTSLHGLEALQTADSLTLSGLGVSDLTALANLREVGRVRLTQNDHLTDLRGLRATIRELWVEKNAKLRTLTGFSGLAESPAGLVRIENQPELESLDGLFRADQPRLQRFQIIGLPKVTTVDLRSARELGAFVVRSCASLQEIRGLDSVEAIGQLHMTGLSSLVSLPAFERLQSVGDLELIELPLLRDLSPLSNVTSVEKMALSFMDQLVSLHGLEKVSHAERILIENLVGLESLDGLSGLQTVNTLWIHDDDKLESLRGLRLNEAFELAVRYNDKLQTLDGLETFRKVGTLDVSENPALVSVRALSRLREAGKIYARANGKLPQCELERVLKQLPAGSTHELSGNGSTPCSR